MDQTVNIHISTEVADVVACFTVTIASRTSLIAADIIVIGVTWWSTYGLRQLTRDARLGTSFGTLLLRDGE